MGTKDLKDKAYETYLHPAITPPMTLEKAREFLQNHVYIGHDYNRNAAKLLLAEVMRKQVSKPLIT